jgi:hypothetical protein
MPVVLSLCSLRAATILKPKKNVGTNADVPARMPAPRLRQGALCYFF